MEITNWFRGTLQDAPGLTRGTWIAGFDCLVEHDSANLSRGGAARHSELVVRIDQPFLRDERLETLIIGLSRAKNRKTLQLSDL